MQMGQQLQNGGCNDSAVFFLHLWDLSVLTSLAGYGVRVADRARVSFCRGQLSAWFRRVIRFSTLHGVNRLSRRNAHIPVPASTHVHSLNARSILGEFNFATHLHQVSDWNDWSVNVYTLEIDVDVGSLSVKSDCFLSVSRVPVQI